jgi:hypothetical protein
VRASRGPASEQQSGATGGLHGAAGRGACERASGGGHRRGLPDTAAGAHSQSVFGRPRRVEVQRDVESATAFARVETLSNGSHGESRVRRAPLRNRSKGRERAERAGQSEREREAVCDESGCAQPAVQFSAQTLTDTHIHIRSRRPRALRNKLRPETTGVPRR